MKKMTVIIICFAMVATMLAGCSQNSDKPIESDVIIADNVPGETLTPVESTESPTAPSNTEWLVGDWELDVAYTEAATGVSMRDVFGTLLGREGSKLSLSKDGYFSYYIGSLFGEGTWKADGDTGRYIADVLEFPNEINLQIEFHEFRESPESAMLIVMYYSDYTLYWKAYEPDITEYTAKSPVEDISYHLEISAMGKEFQDMDSSQRDMLLSEYKELTEGYSILARESTDGTAAYIVGVYDGVAENSPLNMMYSISVDGSGEQQLLYREADQEAVELALIENRVPDVGYLIENSYFSHFNNGSVFLIQPKDASLYLDTTINRYLHTANGPEYIRDAVSRGIMLNNTTGPYLCVYRVSEKYGEIFENIPLTEEQVATIISEERTMLTEGFGFTADLYADEYSELFTENAPIPPTVLNLAVEHCDYRFNDPSAIRDNIAEAVLECDWLDEPVYASEAALPRLREILANAEKGYVGACGYGAKLTLKFVGGEKLTVFKGTDDCDTIIFGSYGGYFLGEQENIEFWTMFGLDPETKELA